MAGLVYLSDVDDLDDTISSKFGDLYSTYGDEALATVGIDVLQGALQCCGSSGSSDFTEGGAATHWISNHEGYPCSCCPAFVCSDNSISPKNLYSQGCTSLLSGYSSTGLDWTAVAVAVTFSLSLLNLILALVLVNNRRDTCCVGCCWACVSEKPGDKEGEAVPLQNQQL
ncbi:tetraspanin-3-like [Bolinopsis microptera]|uniref:tetraspanin-3-like n=1 Tax=Bolinopsis microptera TaxID=2820187 RepID=UPI00307AF9CD